MHKRRFRPEVRGRREDLAALIPLFGIIFLMPILANLFLTNTRIFGVPLDMIYLFTVWGLLICGAVGMSYWLPHIGTTDRDEERGRKSVPQSGKD